MPEDDEEEIIEFGYDEDGNPWSKEDIEDFMQRWENGEIDTPNYNWNNYQPDESSEQPEVNGDPAVAITSVTLIVLAAFAAYSGIWMFVLYLSVLLVVLALGSVGINER